MGKKHVIPDED